VQPTGWGWGGGGGGGGRGVGGLRFGGRAAAPWGDGVWGRGGPLKLEMNGVVEASAPTTPGPFPLTPKQS